MKNSLTFSSFLSLLKGKKLISITPYEAFCFVWSLIVESSEEVLNLQGVSPVDKITLLGLINQVKQEVIAL